MGWNIFMKKKRKFGKEDVIYAITEIISAASDYVDLKKNVYRAGPVSKAMEATLIHIEETIYKNAKYYEDKMNEIQYK